MNKNIQKKSPTFVLELGQQSYDSLKKNTGSLHFTDELKYDEFADNVRYQIKKEVLDRKNKKSLPQEERTDITIQEYLSLLKFSSRNQVSSQSNSSSDNQVHIKRDFNFQSRSIQESQEEKQPSNKEIFSQFEQLKIKFGKLEVKLEKQDLKHERQVAELISKNDEKFDQMLNLLKQQQDNVQRINEELRILNERIEELPKYSKQQEQYQSQKFMIEKKKISDERNNQTEKQIYSQNLKKSFVPQELSANKPIQSLLQQNKDYQISNNPSILQQEINKPPRNQRKTIEDRIHNVEVIRFS